MIRPALAGRVPASTASNVDLPAPLGPMSPVMWPGSTSRETASTACIPSKCRLTPRPTSSGRGPAAGSLSATGLPATTSVSTGTRLLHRGHRFGRREDAPTLRDDSSRAEPEEAENEPADAHPLDRRD